MTNFVTSRKGLLVVDRTIVHQFNPERPAVGGIDTVIRDVVKSSSPDDRWSIVGVQSAELGNSGLWQWRDTEIEGRPVRFMPVAAINPDEQRRRVPHTLRLVAGLLRAGRPALPGVLHVHRVDLAAVLTRLYPGSEMVLWIHNNTVSAIGRNSDSMWRHLNRVHGLVERLAIKRARSVVTAGKPELERVSAMHDTCFELPAWYDDSLFHRADDRNGLQSEVLNVAWAGRLEAPKDPNLALDVMAELRRRGEKVKLNIYGSGTLESGLQRRITDESLDDVVSLCGPLPRAQLASHLAEADVLLMTSHFEGSPRILVEALGCGTPVAGPASIDPAGVISSTNGGIAAARTSEAIADVVMSTPRLNRKDVSASVAANAARTLVPDFLARLDGPS